MTFAKGSDSHKDNAWVDVQDTGVQFGSSSGRKLLE